MTYSFKLQRKFDSSTAYLMPLLKLSSIPFFYCCTVSYSISAVCSCVPGSLVASRGDEVGSTKQGSSNGIPLGYTS